jgi:hypothetical protein
MILVLKAAAVLVAAILVGRWFLKEEKRKLRERKPATSVWLTTPGILVVIAILLPFILWLLQR